MLSVSAMSRTSSTSMPNSTSAQNATRAISPECEFALTEPGAGSDTQALVTEYAPTSNDGELSLNGHKKWISCAQFADIFLVFGVLGQRSVACLVGRGTPGFSIEPIRELLGFRAAGLAELHFENVRVPAANMVGKPGFGLSHVAAARPNEVPLLRRRER